MNNVRKLYKAGNSVVVAIPRSMLWQMKADEGDSVKFTIDVGGRVNIVPVKWQKKLLEVKDGEA